MSDIKIEHVRAYLHAGDDSEATTIEDALRIYDDSPSYFDVGAWDYLVSCMTKDVRARIIDRMVGHVGKRIAQGVDQCFTSRRTINTSNHYWFRTYGDHSCDTYAIPNTPENVRAVKSWFDQEITKRLRALAPDHLAHVFVDQADAYRLAADRRRRMEDRVIDLATAIAYADRAPHPLIRHKALLIDLHLSYARCLFDLITHKGRHHV